MAEGFKDYVKVERKTLLRVTRENILDLAEEFDLMVEFRDGKAKAGDGRGIVNFAEGDLIEKDGRKVSWPSEWQEADHA
ncbi:hypothetical protein GCM10010401_07050 [Rarobacter faecitabidus]|uniref:Uncharacterized protein n=1 Tax=Rarobacter faecitabidus TaxID=13243 RepID=A0A542ZTD3_RARFA|nr:hypothetical protein [Rarobacter faecitabidus]TQL63547.1 hypothetical protein FB461_0006 [Rarobacter faecitabidus]